MRVIHSASLLPPQQSEKNIVKSVKAICWSNDCQKAAVCRPDNIIQLYDGKGFARDKFHTRPRDTKENTSGYQVTAMTFSPDGCSLAVGQSDGIVFIYKIGEFKEKKSISNKFPQPCPVTALEWPNDSQLFIGLLDGKIRVSHNPDRKSNKVTLAHSGESPVIRLTGNSIGTELAASFLDGKVLLFSIGEMEQTLLRVSIRHARPATALCIGPEALIAGGSDQKLVVYEKKAGKVKQTFDYSKNGSRQLDMTWCAMSTAGNSFITASSNKLKVYLLNSRTKKWEEGKEKQCPQIFHPTCFALRRDGTFLTVGTCAGSCEMFELIYKRTKSQKIDVNYLSPSHVVVTVYTTNQRAVLKSKYHNEIIDVKLMGKDRYVVAKTTETMFISDLEEEATSEVPWPETEDSERFYFAPTVCMIFNHGELSLLEYGKDEILGTYRTSVVNPHVISVRINERVSTQQMLNGNQNKRMSYLLDYKTIQIVDLEFSLTLGSIIHDHKIDWLELNETGTKLTFRDRRSTLFLVDVNTMEKYVLDRSCGFVQWVPGCDVIVCQSGKQIRIWYNMDAPELSVDQDVHGIATEIERENEQSFVIMKEGSKSTKIPLDENRIQFSAALELGNLSRATYFLEESRTGPDMASMWVKLGRTAALQCDPRIALRAFSAVDDIPKTRFLNAMIKRNLSKGGPDYDERQFWKSDYFTKANMHLLVGDVQKAVTILFDNDDVDSAIEMYSSLHEFDLVIELIKTKHHPNESSIVQEFVAEWYNTEQYDLLGNMAERVGKHDVAICFFLEAGYPNKAAPYALQNQVTLRNQDLVRALTESLVEKNFVEDAGNIFEATNQHAKALDCFRRGKFFDKAVNLARNHFQYEVVPLEEEWGDHLMFLKQYDAASNHFIEAGNTLKALEAIIEARQFKKAAQIIDALEVTETVAKYYVKIGEYFKDTKNYSQAEKCFARGGAQKKAIDMYTALERWGDAYRVASDFNESRTELHDEYLEQARQFQNQGRLGSAEKVLLAIDEVDLAISMYAKAKRYDEVLRLVETHHPEHTNDTKIHLAEVLMGEENFKGAEMQFIKANQWESAVQMYESRKMWEDAVRVARGSGGISAFRQVVFRWARTLPVESAVKLLNKYGYLEDCIIYSCQQGDFQFAENISEIAAPEKLSDVHLTWGQFLEQRKNYDEAKMHYLKANKPRMAIDMLINANDIQEAIVTADKYSKDELPRVLQMYAKQLFAQKDYTTFESVMLRAEKVVQAIEMYKGNNMWAEALKLSKQYVPAMFNQLNEEYAMYRTVNETMAKEPMELVQQARELERQGDYQRAIDRYLQLTPANLNDDTILCKCWVRSAELAKKFLPKSQWFYLMKGVAPMLDGIKCYSEAASMFLQVNMYKDALNSMIMGGLWTEAMRLAREMGPETEDYVRQKQAESFRNTGKMERLDDLGMDAQLDLLCEKNMWKQALERAKPNNEMFAKYLAKYVTHIVKTRSPQDALEVYVSEYGPLIHKLHLNLYRAIATLIINDVEHDDFETWKKFRDVMFDVCYGLRSAGLDPNSKTYTLMESYLWVMHLMATKSIFKTFPQLEHLAAKIAISLLRFVKIVNPERAFYEAGTLCKQVKLESNAFVFFNYYMDIHDAVIGGIRSTADLDHSDLIRTDIPRDVDLNNKIVIPAAWHDKVKEWVLAISMDSSVTQELTTDERGVFEGSLVGEGKVFDACVVTGFPVLYNKVTFQTTKKYANKDDWNRFLITCRGENNDPRLDNIIQFIEKWAGPRPTYN